MVALYLICKSGIKTHFFILPCSVATFGYTGEYTGDSTQLIYLRSRMYDPASGRFNTKDSWHGDYNKPLSLNRWNYGYGNPVNHTDPTGHSPLGQNPCDGQPNYEICYARWIVNNGGKLTEDIVESIYHQYPEETLQLIQQQFDIQLPPGYYFRYAPTGSPAFQGNEDAKGVNWWMTEYLPLRGKIFEISENGCFLLDSTIHAQAIHIDYTIYITNRAFVDFKDYSPDDIATIMIHEATHAWQERVARDYVVDPRQPIDPANILWFYKYGNGLERQADDRALDADSTGRVDMSGGLWAYIKLHQALTLSGPDFPYPIPSNVP